MVISGGYEGLQFFRARRALRRARRLTARFIVRVSSTVFALRIPLLVAGLACLIFSTPDQILELYLMLASDTPDNLFKIASFAAVMIVLFCALDQSVEHIWLTKANCSNPWLRALLARTIASLPLIGVAAGLYHSYDYFGLPELQEVISKLSDKPLSHEGSTYFESLTGNFSSLYQSNIHTIDVLWWTAASVAAISLAFIISGLLAKRGKKPMGWFVFLQRNVFIITSVLILIAALQTSSGPTWLPFSAISLSSSLGTITWVGLFLVILLFFVSRLHKYSRRIGLPIGGVLVIIAVLLDWSGINDNHTVRTVKLAEEPDAGNLVTDEFTAWWEARPKESVLAFSKLGRPYPVYVVAARGGGLYASYQAAIALARLYDQCPAMIDHLFLISSVSGGSLGAAAFNAATKIIRVPHPDRCVISNLGTRGPTEVLIDRFFSSDLLAPLVASALFPDFAQRFLPYPVVAFDRARALERAIEAAWRHATDDTSDIFSEGITTGHKLGVGPLQLMNVTRAETGEQLVVAPIGGDTQWNRSSVTTIRPDIVESNTDIALSTAAGLSARFPFILPPASVAAPRDPDKAWRFWPAVTTRLVDGGYFENSGADTALTIIKGLEQEAPAKKIPQPGKNASKQSTFPEYMLKMIIFGSSGYYDRLYSGVEFEVNGFTELMTPPGTLLNTRDERGELAVQRAIRMLEPSDSNASQIYWNRTHEINLNHLYFRYPLGWQLSSVTRRLIAANVSEAAVCNLEGSLDPDWEVGPNGQSRGVVGFTETFQKNACAQCEIIKEVSSGLKPDKAGQRSGKEEKACRAI